jgi:hypothetical protein
MLDHTTIPADTLSLPQLPESVKSEMWFPSITLFTDGIDSRFALSVEQTDASSVEHQEELKSLRDRNVFKHFVPVMNYALDFARTRDKESLASLKKSTKDHEKLVVPKLVEVYLGRDFCGDTWGHMNHHLAAAKVYAAYVQGDKPDQEWLERNEGWLKEWRTKQLAEWAELEKESKNESKETGRPAVCLDLDQKNELFDVCRQVYTGPWTLATYRCFCYLLEYGDVAGTPRG